MTSGEKAEPERSAISSTDCRHCLTHPLPGPHTDGKCCLCGITREVLEKPECEHPNKLYTGSVYNGPAGRKTFLFYTCPDCKVNLKEEELDGFERPESSTECEGGCRIYAEPPCVPGDTCICCGEWWKHGCKHSLPPEPRCAGCGDQHGPEEHEKTAMCGYCDAGLPMACTCGPDEACGDPCDLGEEPPLTPEEEERIAAKFRDADTEYSQAPEDRCTCGETACESELCDCDSVPCPVDHAREANEAACQDCLAGVHGPNAHRETPPQPDRRPPYLLAYSVQGHLYEIALPGDATVATLDGRLVITHHLGPVAGICQIAPITSEESHA